MSVGTRVLVDMSCREEGIEGGRERKRGRGRRLAGWRDIAWIRLVHPRALRTTIGGLCFDSPEA